MDLSCFKDAYGGDLLIKVAPIRPPAIAATRHIDVLAFGENRNPFKQKGKPHYLWRTAKSLLCAKGGGAHSSQGEVERRRNCNAKSRPLGGLLFCLSALFALTLKFFKGFCGGVGALSQKHPPRAPSQYNPPLPQRRRWSRCNHPTGITAAAKRSVNNSSRGVRGIVRSTAPPR